MKALEILKKSLKFQKTQVGGYGYLKDKEYKEVVDKKIMDLDEAISELEELIKPKSCETCKHIKGIYPKLGQTYCAIGIEDLNYDLGVKKDFCCSRYEPKETL